MKKIAITCALLSSLVASSVWADAASDLKSRLDKVSSFHASFTQKVTDGSGAAVQEGQGDLWVKRPNLFNWHMTQPDESILVSDGKTLWFYNPFVEQATATWLKDATGNTPFMLIARNQSTLFLSGLVALYPLVWLCALVGTVALFYTGYLLYLGIPSFLNINKEEGLSFSSSTLAIGVLVLEVLLALTVILWGYGYRLF